jgi:hypothetical protein
MAIEDSAIAGASTIRRSLRASEDLRASMEASMSTAE